MRERALRWPRPKPYSNAPQVITCVLQAFIHRARHRRPAVSHSCRGRQLGHLQWPWTAHACCRTHFEEFRRHGCDCRRVVLYRARELYRGHRSLGGRKVHASARDHRLIDPSAGRILCDGTDITTLRGVELRRWRARAAMIFQQFNLVGRLDVLTNVLMGRLSAVPTWRSLTSLWPAEDKAVAMSALEQFDIAALAAQRADQLSGGQQQRVAIARAGAGARSRPRR
jgi:hypothetical protein